MKHFLMLAGWMMIHASLPVYAQIFDDPQNLEVLPEDISPEALRQTMRGFAMATGHRCHDCHVGEAGADLSTYDFASDEKELKATARTMLRMVSDINGEYLESLGEDRVQVRCVTCHRGVATPRLSNEVLYRAATQGGAEGLAKTYRELRERYYGTHSYDFSDRTLASVAQDLAVAGRPFEARTMLDLMLADNPESFNANLLYGDLEAEQGNSAVAGAYYRKALAINPQAEAFIQPKLDALSNAD